MAFPSSILPQASWLVIAPIHYCDSIGQQFFQPDALHSETAFYDGKTEVLYLSWKPYNADIL